jgi:hypothetical protein
VPARVLAVVGYAWLCSLSFVVLVPTDIWTAISGNQNSDVGFFWSWSYWSTFILAWYVSDPKRSLVFVLHIVILTDKTCFTLVSIAAVLEDGE